MRSLSREAKFAKRVKVIELRRAGRSYVQIALQVHLSRTGVFDICKRHAVVGIVALHDAPSGRTKGDGRTLSAEQESLPRRQIIDSTPDELAMPEALWNRTAVARLIERRLKIVLPIRTLALYLARWGFTARRPMARVAHTGSHLLSRWLTDRYPLVSAKSKSEGGEVNWGAESKLSDEDAHPPRETTAATTKSIRARRVRRSPSMIYVVTNKGQMRWAAFYAPLDATTLVAFLRRLIRGERKKVFLIMDDLRVPHEDLVQAWLAEHEDEIEAFHLPAHHLHAA